MRIVKCLVWSMLCLMVSWGLYAQSGSGLVYPVKINHKWGYINNLGEVVIDPKYDHVDNRKLSIDSPEGSKVKTELRLVELNGKLGVIDRYLREILAPAYDMVQPLSGQYFMVKMDTLTTIVNRSGQVLIDQAFDDLDVIGINPYTGEIFLKVKKDNKWGCWLAGGQLEIPTLYKDIELVTAGKNSYFRVQKEGEGSYWGLVDRQNKLVFPFEYNNIYALHKDFICLQQGDGVYWEAKTSDDIALLDPVWTQFSPLNNDYCELVDANGMRYLYAFALADTLSMGDRYDSFGSLDQRYIIGSKNGLCGLLDSLGNEILAPTFTKISGYDGRYYKVRRSNWGLYDLEKGEEVLPCEYEYVGRLQDGFATVAKAGGKGIIDEKMQPVIPPMYSKIQRDGNIFKAFNGRSMTIYELNENGEVVGVDDYQQVFTLRVGKSNNANKVYQEASTVSRIKSATDEAYYMENFPSPRVIAGTPWLWSYRKQDQKWRLFYQEEAGDKTQEAKIPDLRSVKHVQATMMSLLFHYNDPVFNKFTTLTAAMGNKYCRMSIFRHEEGQITSDKKWLGLRRHDFERGLPVAAVIDTSGQFGLLDINGAELKDKNGKPKRFSYIGEFIEGKAKVCIDGAFALLENPNDYKISVENVEIFRFKFGLTQYSDLSMKKEDRLTLKDQNGKKARWGFIDTTGRLVVPPKYDFVQDFEDGQVVAVLNGSWGVLDANGNTVLDFNYASVSDYYGLWKISKKSDRIVLFNEKGWEVFSDSYDRRGQFEEGYCKVMNDSLWGFIDEDGVETVPCIYNEAHDFSEGMAAVFKEGQWHYIDTTGREVIHMREAVGPIDTLSDFHNGLAWYKTGGRWYGFIDPNGKIALKPEFTKVFDFTNGVARVVSNRKTGLIDTSGVYVLKPNRFERIYPMNEFGTAVAMEKFRSGIKGVINNKGEVVTPLTYRKIEFEEGFGKVSDGKYHGLINLKGELVIPLEYGEIGTISEGLLPVSRPKQQKWFFVDTTGRKAFDGYFDIVNPFSNGLADVQENAYNPTSRKVINTKGETVKVGKDNHRIQFYENGMFGIYTPYTPVKRAHYFYADRDGKNLFGRYFQNIEPFKGSIAQVTLQWRKGVINRKGMMVLRPKYFFLQLLEDGFILVRPPEFGIADRAGNILIAPEFDEIELMKGNLYRLEKGEKIGYKRTTGEWIWEPGN